MHVLNTRTNLLDGMEELFRIIVIVFWVFWDWIYFNFAYFFVSITSTKQLAAILKISVLLYSPVGEYKSLIRQIWPINL
jgi:hypothetical protein